MSNSNEARLYYAVEGTYGTDPGGNYRLLNFSSESLAQETSSTVSEHIRPDRQVTDVIRTSVSVAGDINGEMLYGGANKGWDDLMQYALLSAAWTSQTAVITSSVVVGWTSSVLELSAGTWTNTPSAGDIIYVSGFATAASNGFWRVAGTGTDDNSIAVLGPDAPADDAEGDTVTIVICSEIVTGTTLNTFHLEKDYTDLTNEFATFGGLAVDQWELGINTEQVLTTRFGLIGKSETSNSSSSGGTLQATSTNSVMQAVDNVTATLEGGSAQAVTGMSLRLGNNLRARQQVGTLGTVSVGTGKIDLTGSLTTYFTSAALLDKYLNWTTSSLAITLKEGSNYYFIDIPNVKYTRATRLVEGQDGDVMASLDWTAFRYTAESEAVDYTMKIAKTP